MKREEFLKSITKATPKKYCEFCGKKLERKRFSGRLEDLKVFKNRKYCDKECMKKAFIKTNAEKQEYGPAHASARMIMKNLKKTERKCEICGNTKNLDVHHIDKNFRNNSLENLMIVCRSCHLKLHKQKSVCIICGKPMDGGLGYCNKHYIRYKKYGNPLIVHGKENIE